MTKEEALAELTGAVRESGLVQPGDSAVVMISGGADSACVAAGVARMLGAESVHAFHFNYGLRDGAAEGEGACRRLCAALRLDLHVERPKAALRGNLQAEARRLRYGAAERLRERTRSDLVVTGHTRTDLAETLLYRLAVSPGSRGLLGLAPRNGRVVRPLLGLDRERVRELADAASLPFVDDETNDDTRFARNRIRHELLPVLRDLSPAAERNIAETRAELGEEAELLDRVVLEALAARGAGAGAVAIAADRLADAPPALQRLGLRALAERAAGRAVALGRGRTAEILRLAAEPEGGEVELGAGLRAVCEAGLIRFQAELADAAPDPQPEPAALRLPGTARVGAWEVRAELHPAPVDAAGPDVATLDAAALGGPLEVRTWREGDRIRSLGMEGTKSLQDLFTDAGVPRSLRRTVPVVTAGGEVAWVAGVAVAEAFRLTGDTEEVAVLSARRVEPDRQAPAEELAARPRSG